MGSTGDLHQALLLKRDAHEDAMCDSKREPGFRSVDRCMWCLCETVNSLHYQSYWVLHQTRRFVGRLGVVGGVLGFAKRARDTVVWTNGVLRSPLCESVGERSKVCLENGWKTLESVL